MHENNRSVGLARKRNKQEHVKEADKGRDVKHKSPAQVTVRDVSRDERRGVWSHEHRERVHGNGNSTVRIIEQV